MRRLDERGALGAPLLLSLLAICFMGFGTWGILRHWRHAVETQLKLDRCVGEAALELKASLNRIESSNSRMRKERAGVVVTVIAPPIAAALRTVLMLEMAFQEFERLKWEGRRAMWIARGGCGTTHRDWTSLLPAMKWVRPPPDPLGPRPLVWMAPPGPSRLEIRLKEGSRSAGAAVVTGADSTGVIFGKRTWKAKWIPSGSRFTVWRRLLRPNPH
jgi:hypothetical protein